MSRRVAVAGLAAYVLALAAVTLGASPGAVFALGARAAQDIGLDQVTSNDVERAANVVLFVPAGLLLCAAFPGLSRLVVWLLCVAASVSVEAAQILLPGRHSSPVDVVTNATGAALGVLLHVVVGDRRRTRPPGTGSPGG